MEATTELASEIDARQAEDKVVEMGDASEETRGGQWGGAYEFPGWFF